MSATTIYAAIALYFLFGTIVAISARRGMGKGVAEFFLLTGQSGVL